METTAEATLWSKLLDMGFAYKGFTVELSFIDSVKNLFGANIEPTVRVNDDFLIKEINGKTVEVSSIDIWYTHVTVDGECVFDDRRFQDQDLFDAINEATNDNMVCGVCNGDSTMCDGC